MTLGGWGGARLYDGLYPRGSIQTRLIYLKLPPSRKDLPSSGCRERMRKKATKKGFYWREEETKVGIDGTGMEWEGNSRCVERGTVLGERKREWDIVWEKAGWTCKPERGVIRTRKKHTTMASKGARLA